MEIMKMNKGKYEQEHPVEYINGHALKENR